MCVRSLWCVVYTIPYFFKPLLKKKKKTNKKKRKNTIADANVATHKRMRTFSFYSRRSCDTNVSIWFLELIYIIYLHARMISCAPTAVNTIALVNTKPTKQKKKHTQNFYSNYLFRYIVQMAFLLLIRTYILFFFLFSSPGEYEDLI